MSIPENIADKLKQITLEEMENPTWNDVKKWLSVHKVNRSKPIETIWAIEKDIWYVYINIDDERFYYQLTISKVSGEYKITRFSFSAGSMIDLIVISNTTHPDTVTDILGLNPHLIKIKGQKKFGLLTHEHYSWFYKPSCSHALEMGIQLNIFLSELNVIKDKLNDLPDDCRAEINISYIAHFEWPDSYLIDKDTIGKLSELNINFFLNNFMYGEKTPD